MSVAKPILLVDDDPYDVELTLMALEEIHLANDIKVTRDGSEALDYLFKRGPYVERAGNNPILVLLDNKMPKVDGLEVLRQIKTDPKLKTTPVVMLTSSRQDQDLLESYHLGANAYVVKPVIFTAFIEAVKRLGLFWLLTNEAPPP